MIDAKGPESLGFPSAFSRGRNGIREEVEMGFTGILDILCFLPLCHSGSIWKTDTWFLFLMLGYLE